MFINKMG